MRKQELIHLHGLFAEVALYFETQEGASFDLGKYRSLNVNPRSLHHSKCDHRDAVFALADSIEGEMEIDTEGPVGVGHHSRTANSKKT